MEKQLVYKEIASRLNAMENCLKSGNQDWAYKHEATIRELCANELPSGSGFNNGTGFDFDKSTPEKLVFLTSYHHMNDGSYYDGWTAHSVIVTPSLQFGFNIKVTGQNRNDIKDYIAEMFT